MKVTLIQMDIVWGDIAANCETASQMIDSQPGSDLYVLPEMFSTGFAAKPEDIADDSLLTLIWMQQKANATDAAIAGSVATKCEDGTYRNRFYFVKPQSTSHPSPFTLHPSPLTLHPSPFTSHPSPFTLHPSPLIQYYDKRHLFTYGKEHHRYTAGQERVVVEWRGARFLLQVCYDLRFPCFSRNKGDYDCAIYVASWPTSRIEPWRALLRARAIENQCYVLAVDRIGADPVCTYCGGTEIVDAYGRVIESCPDNEACTITTEIDMDALAAFRRKFPVLDDAD